MRFTPVRRPGETAGGSTTVVGSYISPYVRKVLVCLDLKGIEYRIDPIVPFYGNDEFGRVSPLRRVPVLLDAAVTLPDSTAICEYLEERYPEPRLLPEAAADRALARWLEEFADTRMGEVLIWRFFNQLVIRRFVWGEAADEELLRRAREEEIPDILDYLESLAPRDGFLFGRIATADVAIASLLRNARFAGHAIDAERWPRTAVWIARTLDQPAFVRLRPFEELSLRTPIAKHREVLAAAGAPVTAKTYGVERPRRGILATE